MGIAHETWNDMWDWFAKDSLYTDSMTLAIRDGLFADLRAVYTDREKRWYHDYKHITEMIHYLRDLPYRNDTEKWAIIFAAFYHDYRYPQEEDAERMSAFDADRAYEIICNVLGRTNYAFADLLFEAICATKHHETDHPAIKHLIDADLARFCTGDWKKWAKQIRFEYRQHPDEKYNIGREAVLTQFMTRTPFYYSQDHGLNGDRAYQNIAEQIAAVQKENA